jgi:hypothetical protein
MEKNKYYTPTIEEFHVGFECEIQSSYGWQKGEYPNILKQDTLTFQDSLDNGIIEATKKSGIRVKYLDREDIESLGWNASPDEPEEWFWSLKGNMDFQLYFDDKCKVNNENSIGVTIYMQDGIIFNGWLYNKSELKKLMQQLGINGQL